MSHILFTYHMRKGGVNAEACITLPMTKEAADTIMSYGPEQIRWDTIDGPVMRVFDVLKMLALLQGYRLECVAAMERID